MNNIFTVVKKEFTDILRDRKTLLMTFIIPIIMPLIFTFTFSSMGDQTIPSEENKYKIAIETDSSSLKDVFSTYPATEIIDTSGQNAIDQAYNGDILVFIQVEDNFDQLLSQNKTPTIKLYYDTTSQTAQTADQLIQSIFSSYQNTYIKDILVQNNLPTELLAPYSFQTIAKDESSDGISAMILAMIIPMMIIGYAASGIIPIATDLGAGEKERGTLEPLLSTSASRSSILIAKLIVTSTFGIITSTFSALGLIFAFKFGMPSSLALDFNISIQSWFLILSISILYSIFISAILLLISTYARSVKEANTYLTPCTLIPIILSIFTMYMEPKDISILMLNIPVLNSVLIIKEIIVNQLNYTHLYITLGWSVVYIIVAMWLAKKLYNNENIIFRT